ncbi:MAG: PAS domain-containing sensor histidine kinase [Oscillospiraceae bacterium]|nr:PAS domain-containing sensor histidine kinase [Oscillospiraceae bacterium]MCM0706621.1 PAS domain-containing sensor histidine kinase [Faecalicatena sp. BF-R-105]MDY3219227.1 ATP-binding protein [Candidatus Fimivivens sp.]SFJ22840.1 two-component system, OmpR family, sensor histidine kinase KdpD [Ruminococcaceae bacterium D5]GKH50184.1 hypothetical protein CE91St46_12950 [Eubacteriales bacterium]
MIAKLKQYFPCCWQDTVVLTILMASALDICLLLQPLGTNGLHVPLVFVLAVLITAGHTTGYLYGILASVIAMFGVNFVLTSYFSLRFWLAGYPLTFLTMFSVSIVTSTFTTKTREQERIRIDAEREKMRANLLRGIGHDLRTPLTSIIAATNLLLEDGNRLGEDEQREMLCSIRDESEWLIRMVENLLSITRFDGGAAKLKRVDAAAEELMGEVAMKFQKRFPEVRVDAVSPNELLMISADVVLIEQVLFNLMENAVLHGHADAITLSVEPDGKKALFQVEDNGCGIDEALLPHLFEDYVYQITGESSHDMKQNLGIGLSVCMAILKAHNSTLRARNKTEGGAVFSFILS